MYLPAAGAEFPRHQPVQGAQENTKHIPIPALCVACAEGSATAETGQQHQNAHIPSPGACPAPGTALWQS